MQHHARRLGYWNPIVFRHGQRTEIKGRFGPDVYLEHAIDFMQRHRHQPFLAYYATPLVHVPAVTTPNSPNEAASQASKYAGMVRYVDHQVGQLVAALERLRLREETIVIIMTDNGPPAIWAEESPEGKRWADSAA